MESHFNKVAGLRACKACVSQRSCFPVKFAKFLKAFIFTNISIFNVTLFTMHGKYTANDA